MKKKKEEGPRITEEFWEVRDAGDLKFKGTASKVWRYHYCRVFGEWPPRRRPKKKDPD